MLSFAATGWLWGVGAAALIGAWTIWRGQRQARPVSSLRLWRGLAGAHEQTRRRVVDPLWVMIFLAALLAALALARPRWVVNPAGSFESPALAHADLECAVRSIRHTDGDITEAWIRIAETSRIHGTASISLNNHVTKVPPETLHKGISLPVKSPTPGPVIAGSLTLSDDRGILAEREFKHPAVGGGRTFGLLQVATKGSLGGREIDAALDRVFAIQPGARRDDPSQRFSVLLVNDPTFTPNQAGDGPLLLIAQPQTPLPGLQPVLLLKPPPGIRWTAKAPARPGKFAWPPFIKLDNVRVDAIRDVTLSAEWEVIATAGDNTTGKPWIAVRQSGSPTAPVLMVWLASSPATDTDWPLHSSFVLFFAELANRLWPAADARPVQWEVLPPATPPGHAKQSVDLDGYAGLAAILLILAAVGWYLRRT